MFETAARVTRCPGCGAEIAPTLQACPVCRRLTHAEQLGELSAAAQRHETEGRVAEAVSAWRSALELLPIDAPQADTIRTRVDALSQRQEAEPTPSTRVPKWLAPLGAVGLMLWKVKFAAVFLLTKGKVLLLGLTKASTFFSMLAALGVYWTLWGWKFALGFVLMIYVHEMGHVMALMRLGIAASAPMFIPGLGAVVRLKQYPASPREDARVGLAGPIWGLGAAVVVYACYIATGYPILAGLAHAGALINLFNLIPVWQLDGGRGMRALARPERFMIGGFVLVAYVMTSEGTLLLILIATAWKAFEKDAPAASDRRAFAEFAGLILALALLTAIRVPGLARF